MFPAPAMAGSGESVVLRGHQDAVFDGAFSPDGTQVVTASADGTAQVWRVEWAALVDYLSEATTTCLTVEDRMTILLDSQEAARTAHEACERSHGRTPLP